MEKVIFIISFLFVGYLSFSVSSEASIKIKDNKYKKIPMYNPLWFLYVRIFDKSNLSVCYKGAIIQITLIILVAWGFPKYIFEW